MSIHTVVLHAFVYKQVHCVITRCHAGAGAGVPHFSAGQLPMQPVRKSGDCVCALR
jgi:hypothetical protein